MLQGTSARRQLRATGGAPTLRLVRGDTSDVADRGLRRVKGILWTLGVAGVILVPSFLFLGRYAIEGTGIAPAGSDTPQHVWRSAVVARLGLDALPPYEGDAHALLTNADRPGLPLVF